MITQVEFNTKNENPFYGMGNTLSIFQDASKGVNITQYKLQNAWDECKDINQKAVLLSILFSVGDITARQHNIFESKVESGGNSQRDLFRDSLVPFMKDKVGKENIHHLMNLITEYTVMDNILANRVVTKKKTSKYLKTINMIDVFGIDTVAEYCANIIVKGTTFQKICLAKFLTRPVMSKRKNHKRMLDQTKVVMQRQSLLIKKVSDLAGLAYEDKVKYIDFKGYYSWRKEFNSNSESVLFSSGLINDLDKEEFIKFVQTLPADARFRVRNRVLFNDKWAKLKPWFQEWEKFKETAQKEQRVLETKIEQGTATDIDVEKLKQVKKKAKVNVGSESFSKMFKDIIMGNVDKIKVQPFIDKVNLPYNTLTFIDDSGSMSSTWGNEFGFSARQFAAFIGTICLMKNPDMEAKSLIGLFSSTCRMFNGVNSINTAPNSLLAPNVQAVKRTSLINPTAHFLDNLRNVMGFLNANSQARGTSLGSVFDAISRWANKSPSNVEELQRFPVWTFISDGNFNNKGNVQRSIADFFRNTQNVLGFKPFILIIDVARNSSAKIEALEGIDNVMVIPPNPASIELFLTNFKDMDTYDVYTPLLSVYRSKRYAPIRDLAYSLEKKEVLQEQE